MTSNVFLKEIEHYFLSMQRFEDKDIQKKALSVIPLVLLEQRAQQRMRALQRQVKKGEQEDMDISMQELVLLELLTWFKEDFFEWVDAPDCDYCLSETRLSHVVPGAERAEMYECTACSRLTAFVRHWRPEALLAAREGRCGEWAAAFTLLCRALGWDARLAVDAGDHVWTEVWSWAQRRWLHCDPCEAACDTPLMYEAGWAKAMTYVIAYSRDDVQDVTWRYSAQHALVRRNRQRCSEPELLDTLLRLRAEAGRRVSAARRAHLTRRTLSELVELMLEKTPGEADQQGRTSGSLAWRLQRGETSVPAGRVWAATGGRLHVRYSAAADRYERLAADQVVEVVRSWSEGVHRALNVFLKVERDWKVVYLCREETAPQGEVVWRFEAGGSGQLIDMVRLEFHTALFEDGQVRVRLCADDKCVDVKSPRLTTAEFRGRAHVEVCATLSGGRGVTAWQHAQLFRQPMDSAEFPFVVDITFSR